MQSTSGLAVDYIVKETGKPWRARIYVDDEEIAEVRVREDLTYVLTAKNGNEWTLSARVRGEIRPFSMTVNYAATHDTPVTTSSTEVLTIRDHLFLHNGRFYMLASTPEGRPLRDFLLGKRYICRLDTFPFSDLTEIDSETLSRLRRIRGTPVGELEGLGRDGHRVHLATELDDIGLPLVASCYLLYSAA